MAQMTIGETIDKLTRDGQVTMLDGAIQALEAWRKYDAERGRSPRQGKPNIGLELLLGDPSLREFELGGAIWMARAIAGDCDDFLSVKMVMDAREKGTAPKFMENDRRRGWVIPTS